MLNADGTLPPILGILVPIPCLEAVVTESMPESARKSAAGGEYSMRSASRCFQCVPRSAFFPGEIIDGDGNNRQTVEESRITKENDWRRINKVDDDSRHRGSKEKSSTHPADYNKEKPMSESRPDVKARRYSDGGGLADYKDNYVTAVNLSSDSGHLLRGGGGGRSGGGFGAALATGVVAALVGAVFSFASSTAEGLAAAVDESSGSSGVFGNISGGEELEMGLFEGGRVDDDGWRRRRPSAEKNKARPSAAAAGFTEASPVAYNSAPRNLDSRKPPGHHLRGIRSEAEGAVEEWNGRERYVRTKDSLERADGAGLSRVRGGGGGGGGAGGGGEPGGDEGSTTLYVDLSPLAPPGGAAAATERELRNLQVGVS